MMIVNPGNRSKLRSDYIKNERTGEQRQYSSAISGRTNYREPADDLHYEAFKQDERNAGRDPNRFSAKEEALIRVLNQQARERGDW